MKTLKQVLPAAPDRPVLRKRLALGGKRFCPPKGTYGSYPTSFASGFLSAAVNVSHARLTVFAGMA